MFTKKGARGCDADPLKVEFEKCAVLNSAPAVQSQTLNFQAAFIGGRFGLAPHLAAVIATLAYSVEVRR